MPDIEVTVIELVPSAKIRSPRIDGSSSALLLVVMILFLLVAYFTSPSTPPEREEADIMPPIMRTKNVVAAVPDEAKTFATASTAERKLPVAAPTTTDDAASPAASARKTFFFQNAMTRTSTIGTSDRKPYSVISSASAVKYSELVSIDKNALFCYLTYLFVTFGKEAGKSMFFQEKIFRTITERM